jgi:hypothetical protein
MNATISIRKTVYSKSKYRPEGNAFSSTIAVEGRDFGTPPTTGLHRNGTLSAEIDFGFRKLLDVQVNSQTPADVTVNLPEGYTLSAALKQHYADKYSIEPEISSVTFA